MQAHITAKGFSVESSGPTVEKQQLLEVEAEAYWGSKFYVTPLSTAPIPGAVLTVQVQQIFVKEQISTLFKNKAAIAQKLKA